MPPLLCQPVHLFVVRHVQISVWLHQLLACCNVMMGMLLAATPACLSVCLDSSTCSLYQYHFHIVLCTAVLLLLAVGKHLA